MSRNQRRDKLASIVRKNAPPKLVPGPFVANFFSQASKRNHAAARNHQAVIFLRGGRTLVEEPGSQQGPGSSPPRGSSSPPEEGIDVFADNDDYTPGPSFLSPSHRHVDPGLSRHSRKNHRQFQRWMEDVIPKLINPFLDVLRRSHRLRNPVSSIGLPSCACMRGGIELNVLCLSFTGLTRITIIVCDCRSAPAQLLDRGYFGNAPCLPSFAVDLNLLDFFSELFYRMAPNETAVCSTLEAFLVKRGYFLDSEDSLRKRFSKCLRWFRTLVVETEAFVDASISSSQQHYRVTSDCTVTSETLSTPSSPCPRNNMPLHDSLSAEDEDEAFASVSADSTSQPEDAPSPYLRSRCPACFGGPAWKHDASLTADFMVCVDACFQQKRGQTGKGVPLSHPRSVFLPEAEVLSMELEVNRLRENHRKRTQQGTVVEPQSNHTEGVVRVPDEVLDGCESSFKAADERRQKASTRFFVDTGLMALLCRHDCVLWLVNMRSAGEKQHYALALIRCFFQHISGTATVRILYDIGCQLHRSIAKWGFLSEYSARMVFAISVFHAYGHQWTCQIVYHPRKHVGFGLTDGEGCERFWSSIRHLVPNLRISTFYQRLLLLNFQVHFLSQGSLFKLANWLSKRSRTCYERLHEVTKELAEIGISEDILAAEWKAQVEYQTTSMPRQSKFAGRTEIEEIVGLRSRRDIIWQGIGVFQKRVANDDDIDVGEIQTAIKDLQTLHSRLCRLINTKMETLGVSERAMLSSYATSTFITDRMNARALRVHLLVKLRSRRFELLTLERPYRSVKPSSEEEKKADLVASQMKRREPGILKLARSYNTLCKKLANTAPEDAHYPKPVDLEGLFELDIDGDIWFDDSSLDAEHDLPHWLCDDKVRKGVRLHLEAQRCHEELQRLRKEKIALRDWFRHTWEAVTTSLYASEKNLGLQCALCRRQEELLALCLEWDSRLQSVSPSEPNSSRTWGPSIGDLREYQQKRAAITYSYQQGIRSEPADTDDVSDEEEEVGLDDEGLYELAEQVEKEFHVLPTDDTETPFHADDILSFVSPSKRARLSSNVLM